MRTIQPVTTLLLASTVAFVVAAPTQSAEKPKPANNPLAKKVSDPLLGTFKSKDLVAVIQASGRGGYQGTLTLDGKVYAFTAKADGPGIAGTFESDGDKYEFLAKLDGDTLQLKSDDTVYLLIREAPAKPANPLTKKPEMPGKPADLRAAGVPDPGWKLIRHPVGLSVRYPKDWSYKEIPEAGYQLIPPNAAEDEAYILGSYPAQGIPVSTDPQVAAAAEQLMQQLAPALKRVGAVETLKAGGTPVVMLNFEGGPNGLARMYLIILKDQIIGLTGIGAKEKVRARDGMLRKIFTSFSQSEELRDPALVGTWDRLGTTDLAARDNVGKLQARSVGDHRRTLILRADGTCTSRETSRTIAIGQGVSVDTGDQVTTKNGRWYGGEGTIVLVWEKDAEEYDYRITGNPGSRQVVFGIDPTKGLLWSEAR